MESDVVNEGRLNRVQVCLSGALRCQAVGSHDLDAVMGHRQREAGQVAPTVEQHCAGAALAVVTTLLRRDDPQLLAPRIAEVGAGVDGQHGFGAAYGGGKGSIPSATVPPT